MKKFYILLLIGFSLITIGLVSIIYLQINFEQPKQYHRVENNFAEMNNCHKIVLLSILKV